MSAITRYLAMLRLFGMLLCAAAIPSVATATVPVTVAVAASDVEEEAVEASAVGAEAEAARDVGYESAEVPALARRVTDLTATLDAAERARLEASLAALEARKGAQVAILMVPSTYPDSIEAYATRVFEAWKLGRKGIDDGVLVLVAKDDRRMRIEVGYGLEGTITDIDAGRIIREYMTPAFRQQDYAGGLEAAAQRLVRLIDGEALPPPPRDPVEPGAVRQTLAIAFLLGALGGVALLVRPRAWYWTLGTVVALAAALALGRHWPAWAMVALAEMVAVLGVGFGALLKYSRGARWFFAILVLYALGLFWAYVPLWPAGASLRIGRAAFAGADPADAGRCLAGAAQRTALGLPAGPARPAADPGPGVSAVAGGRPAEQHRGADHPARRLPAAAHRLQFQRRRLGGRASARRRLR